MKRNWKWLVVTGGFVGVLGLAFFAGRAWAGGIPTKAPIMTYSGVLQDGTGSPVTGNQIIEVRLWPTVTPGAAGSQLCTSDPKTLPLDVDGRFSIALDKCVATVKANSDLYAEIIVGTTSLGATKLGAVPYAVEAGHATSADTATSATNATTAATANAAGGTLAGSLVPSGLIGMFAKSCPSGWTLCDGSGACPNLIGSYPKAGSAFAAQTGSNTHSHLAQIDWTASTLFAKFSGGSPVWNASHQIAFSFTAVSATTAPPDGSGIETTEATHEPVHATLAFCMKN